ncbi:hypothetical protein P3T16_001791 [Paraburkholderia sp. GAS42]|jgi:hypothetical protein
MCRSLMELVKRRQALRSPAPGSQVASMSELL